MVKNTLHPTWKMFEIASQKLCNSDPDRKIKVEIVVVVVILWYPLFIFRLHVMIGIQMVLTI